jgi:hypothetical protein
MRLVRLATSRNRIARVLDRLTIKESLETFERIPHNPRLACKPSAYSCT